MLSNSKAAAAAAAVTSRCTTFTVPRPLAAGRIARIRSKRLHCIARLSDPLVSQVTTHMDDTHQHHLQGQAGGGAGWPSLLLTCCLLFLSAYGCGMLPRWLPNQQRMTSAVTAVGAGLLLGSALCIILPEGFEAAIQGESHPPGWAISATLLSGFWVMLLLDSLSHWLPGAAVTHSHTSSHAGGSSGGLGHLSSLSDQQSTAAPRGTSQRVADSRAAPVGSLHVARRGPADTSPNDEHTVLLTDYAAQQQQQQSGQAGGAMGGQQVQQLAGRRTGGSSPIKRAGAARPAILPSEAGHSPGTSSGGEAAVSSSTAAAQAGVSTGGTAAQAASGGASGGGSATPAAAVGFDGVSAGGAAAFKEQQNAAAGEAKGAGGAAGAWWRPWLADPTHHALLGLLVHSVSDGLAVGAASLSSVPEISLGVTAAMVVHKGPVAVGLATFLQSASWSPAQVHSGLLLFAAASPLAAVLTYGLLSAVPGITDNIPLVVLFSGGTVLYAATVHVLPSAMHAGPVSKDHEHTGRPQDGSSGRSQLLLVSLGMLLPLVLSAAFGHGHHHHH